MDELQRLARQADRDQTRAETSRAALHTAILAELAADATQADVARRAGRSRETIRKIALTAAKRQN